MKSCNIKRVSYVVFTLILVLILSIAIPATSYAATKTPKKIAAKTIKLKNRTASSLTVAYGKSKNAKKYKVSYRIAKKGQKWKTKTTKARKLTLSNLKPGTYYYVRVRGVNGKKRGKWSNTRKWSTLAKSTKVDYKVDYTKAKDEDKLKISVTEQSIVISIKSLGMSGNGVLYSAAANQYLTGDNLKGLVSKNVGGTKIGSFPLSSNKTFTIDRYTPSGADRLYDKYYIVQNNKIVKGPVYATVITSSRPKVQMDVPSKKGIVDELDEDSFIVTEDLGCYWTALNIDFTSLILANETASGKPIDNSHANADTIEVGGKTYYINRSFVSSLDARLARYQKMGVNVVGIVISWTETESSSNYPRALKYIDDARWTNGFNTSNDKGRDYFIAGMEYLANRYSKGSKGLICDYIIGNEIDYTYDWYEILPNTSKDGKKLPARGTKYLRPGEIEVRAPFDTFMEEYNRTLRLANLAVKKYSSDITVGICHSKEWVVSETEINNRGKDKDKHYDAYSPKAMLDWLNYYTKKEGDYDWTITPHNYPLTHGNSAAYETGLSKDSNGKILITGNPDTSRRITLNNLEVMQIYLDRSYNKYNGSPREIYFTENGCSSGSNAGTQSVTSQREQAAEIAQYYYRASSMPSVKAMIYYKIQDREAEGATSFKMGLKDTTGVKKLSYDVWKYIDTNRSFTGANKYLDSISFKKNGKEYSKTKGNIKTYRDFMEVVDSGYNWDKHWNEAAMTPINIEEESADERSLFLDKEVYDADEPILVTASGASTDLVGLYKKGDTLEDGPIYSYEVGGSINTENDVRNIKHKSGKQYNLCAYSNVSDKRYDEASLPAGEYTVMLSDDESILVQCDLTITGASEYESAKKISTNKTTYNVGEDIIITASGGELDWVGIYQEGEIPSATVNSFFWYYVADEMHVSGKPAVIQNGKTNYRAEELPTGQYEVLLLEDDSYNVIARSETITIESSGDEGSHALNSFQYTLNDASDGFANGIVTVTKSEDSSATECIMYWADESGKPIEGYTALAKFKLNGETTKHQMQANTIIPPGAKTLVAYGASGSYMSDVGVVATLPESCNYELKDDYDASLAVISDLHVVDKGSYNDFNENTNDHLTAALEDIAANLSDSIGIFVNGDIADHGKASEFKTALNLFMGVQGVPDMHLIIGNHDWRAGNPNGQFQKYANLFNPAVEPEEVYYDEWVDGYHFIYMASEDQGDVAYISDEQLLWLEQLLDQDSAEDPTRPVFLFLHEGLADSMAGNFLGQWGYTNGVFQDTQIKKIVSKHGQVIMFGGHTHYDLSTKNTVTVGNEDLPVSVNTSAVGYLWSAFNSAEGEYEYGSEGLYLKVFNDKIYIFGRDFMTGEYISSAMYVIQPFKLSIAGSKISMNVGDSVNADATTESSTQLTYKSSNPEIASVDYLGNIRAKKNGSAKIYISTESSNTRAINRRIITVKVGSSN